MDIMYKSFIFEFHKWMIKETTRNSERKAHIQINIEYIYAI